MNTPATSRPAEESFAVRKATRPAWDVLSRPKSSLFYVDASYSNDVQSMQKSPLAEQLTHRAREGYDVTDKQICALVADPGDVEAFTDGRVPAPIGAMLEEILNVHPEWQSCLFFCFWPKDVPEQAWIYAYQP